MKLLLLPGRAQTIRINVEDVDEAPSFVNAPLPMLAVVPLNPTIGRIVYQFVARDENGDGDSDVHYKAIDVIRKILNLNSSFSLSTFQPLVRS